MTLSAVASTADRVKELDGLEERAKMSGASKLYIEDITDEFAEDYIVPCVMADAVYENKYLLGTSMARPGIAKKLVELPARRMRLPSATALPVRVTTRFVLSWASRLWLLISRSLLPGGMISGTCSLVRMRSTMPKHMAFTCPSLSTSLTAVTVTSGTSPMRVSNSKILPASLTISIC